jgi:hypothetical protein
MVFMSILEKVIKDNGRTIKNKAEELRIGETNSTIKDNGWQEERMVMENSIFKMAAFIKANFVVTKYMAKEFINGKIQGLTKEVGSIIQCVEKASLSG